MESERTEMVAEKLLTIPNTIHGFFRSTFFKCVVMEFSASFAFVLCTGLILVYHCLNCYSTFGNIADVTYDASATAAIALEIGLVSSILVT